MRGSDGMQEALFTVAKLDDFVPSDHPLRPIRLLVNEALVPAQRAIQRHLRRTRAAEHSTRRS